jgi:SpoVK/Ycf46/Vps4 family AAA+-type ATPase
LSLAADRHRLSAAIQNFAPVGKEFQKTIVVISPPGTKLPEEFAPLFHKINHNLPDEAELSEIYDNTLGHVDNSDNEKKKAAVKAALGMTRLQAEGVFAASFVEHKEVRASSVWKYKADILNQDGLVALLDTNLKYADVGGNEGVKGFLKRLLTPNPLSEQDKDVRAKGVVLVGPPGTGKSLIAPTTGNEFGIPTLLANPGNLMGGLVGETEKNTRKFFDICKAMAPCVVIIDEVSKVMPAAGGDHDGGVGSRMLGTFLTQMNDIKESIFWVFTENDISNMHEAFTRAERVDAIFYVRLPDDKQRAEVWNLYLKRFFPATINGKDNPRRFEPNAQTILDEFTYMAKEGKKKDISSFARRIAVSLLVQDKASRTEFLTKVAAVDDVLERAVKTFAVNDEGWTPAEIRSACRLSCLLNEDLCETQLRIRPVCVSAARQIRKLDKWASESALDASTGKLFKLVESSPDTTVPVQTTGKRRLRTDN